MRDTIEGTSSWSTDTMEAHFERFALQHRELCAQGMHVSRTADVPAGMQRALRVFFSALVGREEADVDGAAAPVGTRAAASGVPVAAGAGEAVRRSARVAAAAAVKLRVLPNTY